MGGRKLVANACLELGMDCWVFAEEFALALRTRCFDTDAGRDETCRSGNYGETVWGAEGWGGGGGGGGLRGVAVT